MISFCLGWFLKVEEVERKFGGKWAQLIDGRGRGVDGWMSQNDELEGARSLQLITDAFSNRT